MAETEISVFQCKCWDRRIGEQATLVRETQAWEDERNAARVIIDWQFTTDRARVRLEWFCPCHSA
jgi:hypothetical protein